jgi:hypothetical protein
MAVGSTEVVRGFQKDRVQPQAPALPDMAAICGKCGAVVADGFESLHATFHNTAWTQTLPTVRNARGPFEANSP